jgi:hypothetical protein
MEVQTLQKKTKKLGSKTPLVKKEESKKQLPAIDVESLRFGTNILSEKTNFLHQTYGKYSGVRVLLPNFRYKKGKFYFYMKNPYDMLYGNFLLKKIYQINYFFVKTDLPCMSNIKVFYELIQEERTDGLLCKIYMDNPRDFGKKDFQGICKMIEMTILNMNPTDTYELISYQDVYRLDGEIPHIYESFEEEENYVSYEKQIDVNEEKEEYYLDENHDYEEFNSQLIYDS